MLNRRLMFLAHRQSAALKICVICGFQKLLGRKTKCLIIQDLKASIAQRCMGPAIAGWVLQAKCTKYK
jgi:hypothetical protein